ncbi:hypothetical protein TELCIR_04179 [Teladorsagia circumcincta]|uniref:Uncharacterized protein n=1 Tax=Teladorsagia circumcincta TaxID=45464 RepID=A0A2G9UUA3_TELCI|nr:hypothetical protein TELCIR_04179 [Teladorsagia circumcincta]
MFGSDEWTPKRSDPADGPTTTAGRLMRQLFVRKFTASERQENREKLAALTRTVLKNGEESESEIDECAPNAPLLESVSAEL